MTHPQEAHRTPGLHLGKFDRNATLQLVPAPNGGWTICQGGELTARALGAFTDDRDMLTALARALGGEIGSGKVVVTGGQRNHAEPPTWAKDPEIGNVERIDPAPQMAAPTETQSSQPVAPKYKTTAWTRKEAEDAQRWRDEGMTNIEIAAKLNRNPRAIGPKLAHMAKMRNRTAGDARAEPSRVDTPPGDEPQRPDPSVDPNPGPCFIIDPSKATSGAERLLRMHLREVGYPAPWTPAFDLQLVEGLARGDALGDLAHDMGLEKTACRARYRALLPEPTIDGQTQMLATLRAVASEVEG